MPDQPTNGTPKPDNSSPRSAPTDVPHLALPKSGGAIQDIGEKFAANPVTGAGALTVSDCHQSGPLGIWAEALALL
ncbi:MAG: hypothetical protein WCB11_18595 [Terriglobales bacterium]|jgi:hypothetical protein